MVEKKPTGRPPHAPTPKEREQVQMMAGFGNTEPEIAMLVGISVPTLLLHYREELDRGHIVVTNAVKANLFRQATKDDPKSVNAAIFWLRCRAGWSEYAPAPIARETREPELGKKEQADVDAQVAHEGTSWGSVLQ